MTAVPIQQRLAAQVTVVGDQLEIDHLTVSHSETVALARSELIEAGPAALADSIRAAVVIGLAAIRLARSSGDTTATLQRVLDGFDDALAQRAEITVTQLDEALARVDATEQAARQAVTAAIAELPTRIETGLTSALASGGHDVHEAVRRATATAASEALTQLERVVRLHTDQVRSVVSTENPSSPLAALRRDLTGSLESTRRELIEGLAAVRALVQAGQAQHTASRKTPTVVGREWEDCVSEAVSRWAAATNDVVEHVGSQPAPGTTRKTGDIVVQLMTGTRPRMVIEAKRRQRPLTSRQLREELAEGRRVRNTATALAVVPSPEHVPGPGRYARIDQHSWVVAGDDLDLLTLMLAVIRELTLIESVGQDEQSAIDVARAQTAISHALDLLSRIDTITKNVTTAETALGNIRGTADALRGALTTHLQEASRALRPVKAV
jgi:hypothetical protein